MENVEGFVGYAPTVVVRPAEREIYEKLWTHEEYRRVSPGTTSVNDFLAQARPPKGAAVLDLGCGTGQAGLMLAILGGLDVTLVDFAANCLDEDIRAALGPQAHTLHFAQADLTRRLPMVAPYGFCADVLEHIPPQLVDAVLNNILMACEHVWFQIATGAEVYGALVGHPLHLSQHPYGWWLRKLADRDCLIHWSRETPTHCLFYVTAWQNGQRLVDVGAINSTEEEIKANVRENCAGGWTQIAPHETNDFEVMILGGSPSLADFEEEIKQKRRDGVKLVTLNGAYNWCLEHGLTPSATIVVDARLMNARFTKPVVDECKYLLASQCHPSVFEGLPKDRTFIWHTGPEAIKDILDAQYEKWWPVPGGSSVLLRAIPLMRMLGYRKFHLYGCDSCLAVASAEWALTGHGVRHHAYDQPWNNGETVIPVTVTGGRVFYCHAWMIAQAQEMMSLIKVLGDEIELEIYGDGLLAHILKMGAEMATQEEV